MVRQARSEATRQRIVNAAVELFSEVGYQATGLGDIIERAQLTKGALYYHFDSKEALATAIIEEGADIALRAFRSISDPSSPALENMIHGIFVVADLTTSDKMVRTGTQLLKAFGEFNAATALTHGLTVVTRNRVVRVLILVVVLAALWVLEFKVLLLTI